MKFNIFWNTNKTFIKQENLRSGLITKTRSAVFLPSLIKHRMTLSILETPFMAFIRIISYKIQQYV